MGNIDENKLAALLAKFSTQMMGFVNDRLQVYKSKANNHGELLESLVKERKGPRTSKDEEMKLGDLPEFDGTLDPEVYLDWERRIVRIFAHKGDGSEIQDALAQWTGQRTVPNVFIGGKHIGGCDDTTAKHREGKLVPLLTEAGAVSSSA